jgi:hypothetical protein
MTNNAGRSRTTSDAIRRVVNTARIAGAIVLVVIAVTGVLQLIDFYRNEVGLSAPDAAESYVSALLAGNLDTVYTMTDKSRLTDLYGSPVGRTEFMAQAREIVGADPVPVDSVKASKLYVQDGVHYYIVDITFPSGASSQGKRLLLELRNEEGTWLVTWPFGLTS